MRTRLAGLLLGCAFGSPLAAAEPLSAIDWLSDSIAAPQAPEAPATDLSPAAIPQVETLPLGRTVPDGVGLLSAEAAGLPRALWSGSTTEELVSLIQSEPRDLLPSPRALLKRLLLAELDPPVDAGVEGRLLIARIDRLLELGALDEAAALLDVAGTMTEDLFRRRFDVALLVGSEQTACAELRDDPSISPTYPARIFCLARTEEWHTAAVTLDTATALGLLSPEEDDLLARFLHPELEEELPALGPPQRPSPLIFRLYEAVGEPLPTTNLPIAFAHADLNPNAGWKAQLEAAERLARAGAVAPNLLLGLYTERQASASGGVWERVQATQALDAALSVGDPAAVSVALVEAWTLVSEIGLQAAFAQVFAPRIEPAGLTPEARSLWFRMSLLTDDFLLAATRHQPADAEEAFLAAVALGRAGDTTPSGSLEAAIASGFAAADMPDRFGMTNGTAGRGAALLRVLALFTSGAMGNYGDLRDAVVILRMMGFETVARRSALELLILAEPA
jgi:hypothetical protein